jgi:uncharacterized membrane protein
MIKFKWLIYTVIIGLIPFLIRTFIYLIDKTCTIDYWFNETDFISLGLILNLGNINELEDKDFEDKLWKTKNIGFSIILVLFLAILFAFISYADLRRDANFDYLRIKLFAISISLISFALSYSIYNKLNKLSHA